MKFQSFEKTDKKIVGTATVVLILSLLLLWQDSWIYSIVQIDRGDVQQIGEVTSSENDVRRRYEIAMSWLPLRNQNDVFQGDSIFTGDKSTVKIRTKSGDEITIAPNSLVVITQGKDSISLDIGFGSIQSKVENGKKLLVTSNNKLTEIAGNNASFNVDAGDGSKLVLNVLAGEVKVRSESGTQTLKQDDTTEIKRDGSLIEPGRSPIRLTSPLADQKFKPRDDAPILFTWETARQLDRMKIKISKTKDFTETIVDSRVNDNSYSAYNLPTDVTLFWQVLSESGSSSVEKFVLVGNRAPVPIYPKPGMQFYFDPFVEPARAGARVDLTWEEGSPSDQFELELAKDFEFKKVIATTKTKLKTYATEFLPSGDYFWRVRSIEFPNEKWSEISYFRIGPEPSRILTAPLSRLAETKFEIKTKLHRLPSREIHVLQKSAARKYIESFPTLRWSPVAGADRYEVQISRNQKFSDIILSETHTNTYLTWRNIEPGTYFWRVRGLSENFKESLYTPTQKIQLILAPPMATSQALIVDEVPDPVLLNAPPPPLYVSWNPTVFTGQYEIQFSKTPDFTGAFIATQETNSKSFQVDRPGIYYWRVRSLDRFQNPVSAFSQTNTIEFQRTYKDPALLKNLVAIYPQQQDSIILVGNKSSEINFKWSNPYPDAEYRIELSYDPNFKEVFYSQKTKSNTLVYKETFLSNVVYWRIRVESADQISQWTAANRFLVSYETDPFNFEKSEEMFAARLKARERQKEILLAQQRRLATLRTPAGALELQLDTPQLINAENHFLIESNLDSSLSAKALAKQNFEKFYTQVRGTPTFRWEKVAAAERYMFEIAKDPEFKTIVIKSPTWDPYYQWDTVRPGQFYYRVQAFNDRYMRSQFSVTYPLLVDVAPPQPTSADQYVEVFDEPKDMWQPPSPFHLSWTTTVFARGYEVEFSEDRQFHIAKVFRTDDSTQEFKVSKSGMYYWRVRPISENGIAIGQFSPVRSIEVIQTRRGPASVGNLTGLFPLDRTMLFVGQGVLNLAFHWTAPSEQKTYDIEISDSPNFERVLLRKKSNKNEVVLRDDLPDGKIYWRVKSESETSPVYQFFLRREYEPYSGPSLLMNRQAGR